MREQRAREILRSLVQGTDPATGKELAPNSALQQVEVLRALLAGIAALERSAARAQRKANLPVNVGKPWSADEEHALVRAFRSGYPVAAIAEDHKRTLRAIESRLEKLGLLTPGQRQTGDRVHPPPRSE